MSFWQPFVVFSCLCCESLYLPRHYYRSAELKVLLPQISYSTSDQKLSNNGAFTTTKFECLNVRATSTQILTTITNCSNWPLWISPGATIKTDCKGNQLSSVGDTFSEYFGLASSSMIKWIVDDLKSNESHTKLVFATIETKGTFGWDRISMEFDVRRDTNNAEVSSVSLSYSWLVLNAWISFLEKTLMRSTMIVDNVQAFNRLIRLCEQTER